MKTTKLLATFVFTAAATLSGARAETAAVPQDYPLRTCPVSGEALNSGGMIPYKVAHEGTDVWLCCKSCLKKFNKEPGKFAQAVKDAAPRK